MRHQAWIGRHWYRLLGAAVLAILVWAALTLEARAQTTAFGNRLAIGLPVTLPDGTTVRLGGLGSSASATRVLFGDLEGDIMARLLLESDIPAAFTRRNQPEAISASWTFTPIQIFGGGVRAASGSFVVRNPTNTADILSSTAAGLLTVPSASVTGDLGVGGLSTLAKARTTGIRGVSSPFRVESTAAGNPAILEAYDAGRVVLSSTGTSMPVEYAATGAPTGQRQWRAGAVAGSYAIQSGTDAGAWSAALSITAATGIANGVYLGAGVVELSPSQAYRTMLGTDAVPYLAVSAAELNVGTLVARERITSIGGSLWITRSPTLAAAVTPAATTIQVSHNNLLSGDRVLLQDIGKVEFMAITSGPSGTGPYTYSVSRSLDPTGADAWNAGDTVASTGGVGDGWWEWYADRGVRAGTEIGPTGCANVRTGTGYADWRTALCIGNLRGKFGYGAANVFGLAAGDPADVWFSAEGTNGIRYFADGTDQTAHFRLDGSVLLGREGSGQENVYITPSSVNVRIGTESYIAADSTAGPGAGLRVGRSSGAHWLAGLDGVIYGRDEVGLTRITLGGPYVRFYNQNTEQIGYIGGASAGSAEIVLGRAGVSGAPYFAVTAGGASFCRVGDVTCALIFDGLSGNFTANGSIFLGGGSIQSTGNFSLGGSSGLTFQKWTGVDAEAGRSVRWLDGATVRAHMGVDTNGALRVQAFNSGANAGIRLALGNYAWASLQPGLFITSESGPGGENLTNIVAQSVAPSSATFAQGIQFVPLMAGPTGSTQSARIGSAALPWHHIYGSQFYSNGNAGFTGSTFERFDNGTPRCQYNWSGGIMISTNCS